MGDRDRLEQKWKQELIQWRARIVGTGTSDVQLISNSAISTGSDIVAWNDTTTWVPTDSTITYGWGCNCWHTCNCDSKVKLTIQEINYLRKLGRKHPKLAEILTRLGPKLEVQVSFTEE